MFRSSENLVRKWKILDGGDFTRGETSRFVDGTQKVIWFSWFPWILMAKRIWTWVVKSLVTAKNGSCV